VEVCLEGRWTVTQPHVPRRRQPESPATAPVIDPTVLVELESALGGAEGAERCARTFVRMLPERVARIRSGVAARDTEDLLDATLSLKVSAAMLGARRLEQVAGELEVAVRGHGDETWRTRASGIERVAALTAAHFEQLLALPHDQRTSIR
jgi:HPt (histidine-containing phosphotransfer) domain-containing protein